MAENIILIAARPGTVGVVVVISEGSSVFSSMFACQIESSDI
jgi:hypothetical protein